MNKITVVGAGNVELSDDERVALRRSADTGPTLRRVTPCGDTSVGIAQPSIHEPAVGSPHRRGCP